MKRKPSVHDRLREWLLPYRCGKDEHPITPWGTSGSGTERMSRSSSQAIYQESAKGTGHRRTVANWVENETINAIDRETE